MIQTKTEKLVKEYPIARFNAWSAWLVTGNKNITDCLLDEDYLLTLTYGTCASKERPLRDGCF